MYEGGFNINGYNRCKAETSEPGAFRKVEFEKMFQKLGVIINWRQNGGLCLFVCLPEVVPEGKSVSGHKSTYHLYKMA